MLCVLILRMTDANKLMVIVFYYFNESQFNYCSVSTTVTCIDVQMNTCIWNKGSFYHLALVLFFSFLRNELHCCN